MEMYDDYGQPDIFSSLTNPEHALQSPSAVLLSASQNNMFMYEQEHNTSSNKQEYVAKTSQSDNIFEFPNPEEMAELGCDPLMDSCWPETPLMAGSLDGSLNDSGMYFGWDLSEDDQEALLQSDPSPLISAPTLAELNSEDSQMRNNGLGLKRKHDDGEDQSKDTTFTKVLQGQQEMSLSPQSWKRVKTEAAEMARGDSPKSLGLTRLAHQKHSLARKTSRAKPSRLIAPKSGVRTQHEASKTSMKTEKSSDLTLAKVHPSKIDFTELFWKRYRRTESIPSPTKEMSRSEFIARTPNPFGNRRFLGRNAFLKPKTHHHHQSHQHAPTKVTAPTKTVSKSVLHKNNQRSRSKRPPPIRKLNFSPAPVPDESSQEKLWNELKEYMYGEQQLREGKKDAPHRTLRLPEPDLKSESSKSPRTNTSSDPGFDSHDEGLGSENEDHDESGSDDDDSDIPDDVSDMSDDPGLPSTSTKCPSSSSKTSSETRSTRRRRVKTRRSEYDDFTPNPRKLLHIGHELNKLNMTISGLSPGSEASNEEKNHTRREKNKLASRACRLKKKAQHEANKVKLWGLAEEAKQLKSVLRAMRKEMAVRAKKPKASWDYCLGAKLDLLIKGTLGHMVAGHTSEFVNSVLEKTAKGVPISRLNTKLT